MNYIIASLIGAVVAAVLVGQALSHAVSNLPF
jgi:hypothetical protein